MKRPAWQHYPGDWRNNAKLRRCSWAARGAWVEVLGLMHDSDEYGILRWPIKEIASAVGAPIALVRELAVKAVLKGDDKRLDVAYVYAPFHAGKRGPEVTLIPKQDGPIWFSSRMVRDEYNRTKRGFGSRFGEAPEPSPKAPIGGRSVDGASSSASTSIPSLKDSTETTQRGPRSVDKSTAGQNGLENQKPPLDYRRNPDSAARYATAIGIGTRPGESLPELVERIDHRVRAA